VRPSGLGTRLVPAAGPGITDTTIYLGWLFSSQGGAQNRALGVADAAPTYDARDVLNAVIDHANRHGGFAGRRLKPIYYDYDRNNAASVEDQAACALWTQDHKVFVMTGFHEILTTCAEKAHAVAISAGGATSATFKRFPHLIDPDVISLDRLGAVTASGLYKAGYFTGKLGLVTWDDRNYRDAIAKGYLPTLAARGIKPVDIAYIGAPASQGALPDMAAAVSSAVAKFHSEGIDHVIVQDGPPANSFCSNGCLTLVWADAAKSQQWYPRYGQNANNAPGFAGYPPDEMDHALAIDQADSDPSNDKGWRTNAARTTCFKIQADAGLPVSSSHKVDEAIAALYCDYVFFLQRVINRLSVISNDAFMRAAEGLGTSFPNAFVYGSKFLPGKHDGGDMVRTEEYSASCQCLTYQGPPYYP
jgi:hypothetical protein